MINKIIGKYLDKMTEELLKSNDDKINELKQELTLEGASSKEIFEVMKLIVSNSDFDDERSYQEAVYEEIDEYLFRLDVQTTAYQFRVSVMDQIIQSTRDLRLPATMSLVDMAQAIFTAYRLDGLFDCFFEYEGDRFSLHDEVDEETCERCVPAFAGLLGLMELKTGSVIRMEYGIEREWNFEIRYVSTRKVDIDHNEPALLDGEGYNLWEDDYENLVKLLTNPDEKLDYLENEKLTVKDYADYCKITPFQQHQIHTFHDEVMERIYNYFENVGLLRASEREELETDKYFINTGYKS